MIPSRLRRAGRGMSLIEMILVVGILAVLASIALPRYARAIDRAGIEAAAARCATELAATRDRAAALRRSVRIRFTPGSGVIGVSGLDGELIAALTSFDLEASPYRATILSTTLDGDTLTFDPLGLIDADGVVIIGRGAHQRFIHLSTGGNITWR